MLKLNNFYSKYIYLIDIICKKIYNLRKVAT